MASATITEAAGRCQLALAGVWVVEGRGLSVMRVTGLVIGALVLIVVEVCGPGVDGGLLLGVVEVCGPGVEVVSLGMSR